MNFLRSYSNYILGVLLIVAVVVIASIWQDSTDKQQAELDAQEFNTYLSPGGEFQFNVPRDWKVDSSSTELEGYTGILLNGPQNALVLRAYEEQGGSADDVEKALLDKDYTEIASSLSREYIGLELEAFYASVYEIAESIEDFKQELIDSTSTATGLAFSNFEEFDVDGGKGLRYTISSFEESGLNQAIGYFLLGEFVEMDITIFPANSAFLEEADEIIKSMSLGTTEQLEELLEKALPDEETPEEES